MKLKDKVALITGASRGIGRASPRRSRAKARKFSWWPIATTRRLSRPSATSRISGAEADGGLFDVGNHEEVRRIADAIESSFGTLDIVVNNAGIIQPTPLLEITAEQWERTIRTHLHGTFHCTVEMVNRFMKEKRSGKIVNVAAAAALRGYQGVADYASAKGGIVSFTLNAAKELIRSISR